MKKVSKRPRLPNRENSHVFGKKMTMMMKITSVTFGALSSTSFPEMEGPGKHLIS